MKQSRLSHASPTVRLFIAATLSLAGHSKAETFLGVGAGGMISTYSRPVQYSTSSADMGSFGAAGAIYIGTDLTRHLRFCADYSFAYLIKTLGGAKSRSWYESIQVKPCLNVPIIKRARAVLNFGIGPELGGFLDITEWADDFAAMYQTDPGTTGSDMAGGMIAGLCIYTMFQFRRWEIGPIFNIHGNFVLWKNREVTKGQSSAAYDPSSGVTFQLQLAAGFRLGK
jgi:hypothetical protein